MHPPESIFEAEDENGEKHLFCMASFVLEGELNAMLEQWPTFPNWSVTKEHFTKEELDARKRCGT